MKNVRFKVKDVSFRSSVSNVRPVWTACCDGYGDIHTKKGDIYICDDQFIIDTVYSGGDNIGSVIVGM